MIASGASLGDIGLEQENIVPRGVAMQCRITAEDPGKENTLAFLIFVLQILIHRSYS